MTKKTISVCMIAKDEEHFLKQCLENIKEIADEIIVVIDNRSSDGTERIAREFGAKVELFRWCEDFSAARNRSLELATKDWIFVIDPDEELSEEGIQRIKETVNDPLYDKMQIVGFKLDQRTYRLQDRTRYVPLKKRFDMKNYTDHKSSMLVRLFKNSPKIRFRHRVHELVEDSIRENKGKIIDSGVVLHHFAALKGMEFYLDKIKHYTDIMVKQLKDDPNNIRYLFQAGNIFFDNEEYDTALNYYSKVAEKNPKYGLIHSEIAQCHLKRGDILEAIKSFNTSLRMRPDEPSAANNLAVLYMKTGKYDVARQILEKYIERFPDNEPLKFNMKALQEKTLTTSTTTN
ncbi:TPA: tetratricopeptide repeat protein [Candidatus Woesearchaeota archaeon]|nr:tetratricopeptide repeat protein [Candidatus Woesearchaeota archaeon]